MLEDNITTRQDPQGGSPGHLGPSTITGTVTHTANRHPTRSPNGLVPTIHFPMHILKVVTFNMFQMLPHDSENVYDTFQAQLEFVNNNLEINVFHTISVFPTLRSLWRQVCAHYQDTLASEPSASGVLDQLSLLRLYILISYPHMKSISHTVAQQTWVEQFCNLGGDINQFNRALLTTVALLESAGGVGVNSIDQRFATHLNNWLAQNSFKIILININSILNGEAGRGLPVGRPNGGESVLNLKIHGVWASIMVCKISSLPYTHTFQDSIRSLLEILEVEPMVLFYALAVFRKLRRVGFRLAQEYDPKIRRTEHGVVIYFYWSLMIAHFHLTDWASTLPWISLLGGDYPSFMRQQIAVFKDLNYDLGLSGDGPNGILFDTFRQLVIETEKLDQQFAVVASQIEANIHKMWPGQA